MASSTKLVPFYNKINKEVLISWKNTITANERIKDRLEEALIDNTKKHGGKNE